MTARAAEGGAGLWPWAAMLGSAALWGLGTVLTKDVLATVPPMTLLALQLLASVGALGAALLVTGGLRAAGRLAGRGWTGLLEPGLAYAVGVPGVMLTTAGAASLIAATEPALVLLVVWALLGQRPGARMAGAVALAMLGVALVTSSGGGEGGGARSWLGDALVLLGTGFAALYVVISSRHVAGASPLALAFVQHAWGLGLVVLVLAGTVALGIEPPQVPERWRAALLSGLVQYALPFWLYLVAVRRVPVSAAALVLTLTPVFGVAGGVLFLGEAFGLAQAAGAALILLALPAVRSRP